MLPSPDAWTIAGFTNGGGCALDWGVEDPAAVEGDEVQKMLAFRKALRELENRIKIFMSLPIPSLDRIKLQSRLNEIGQTVLENHA